MEKADCYLIDYEPMLEQKHLDVEHGSRCFCPWFDGYGEESPEEHWSLAVVPDGEDHVQMRLILQERTKCSFSRRVEENSYSQVTSPNRHLPPSVLERIAYLRLRYAAWKGLVRTSVL